MFLQRSEQASKTPVVPPACALRSDTSLPDKCLDSHSLATDRTLPPNHQNVPSTACRLP